jgi:chaperonin GroEL
MLPLLEIAARDGRPFVIIAEEIQGQLLAALIMNRMRGQMKIVAIKAPRYGEERRNILSDIALTTGATFISKDSGVKLSQVKLEHLGGCKTIEIFKHRTTITGGSGEHEKIEERIEALKKEVEEIDSLHAAERAQERITRLASGIAVIRIGGATEIEVTEKRHRVEDALEAVRSAQEDGIVPGGGSALIRASMAIDLTDVDHQDQAIGASVLQTATVAPMKKIIENAGMSPDLIINTLVGIEEEEIGFNAKTGNFENLIDTGVIDPVKVTKTALRNAASAAGTLLTTNCAVLRK